MRKKVATAWGHEWEYNKEYTMELEAKLWEMIDLKKMAFNGDELLNVVRDNVFNCLDEAEAYLNK